MSDSNRPTEPDHGEVVSASRLRISIAWIFPLLAIGAALWLLWKNWESNGPEVRIRFDSAPGLQAGKSVLTYRGVTAGTITDIHLEPGLAKVVVTVRLKKFAAELASEGTLFWVDQPEISLVELTGIESVVQGNSLRARLGGGPRKLEFEGLAKAPLEPLEAPSLTLKLTAHQMPSVARGAPVYFRGIQVGKVNEIGLDGNRVPFLQVVIDEKYKGLVHRNARFWRMPGASVSAGGGGLKVDVASLAALLEGGVVFNYFGEEGEPAIDGDSFELFTTAELAKAVSEPFTIVFDDGEGFVAGETPLCHLGLPIGLVTAVRPSAERGKVEVFARLNPGTEAFRRVDATFSVVRARVSLEGVSGLSTILRGIYIACEPGTKPELADRFAGRSPGSLPDAEQPGVLSVSLTAPEIAALDPGAPILHRGVIAGAVIEKTIDADRNAVLRAVVSAEFAPLVRRNSRFWRIDGASLELGPGGIDVGIEGIETLVQGGIAFDTFGEQLDPAENGATFALLPREAVARCVSEPIRISAEDGGGLTPGVTQLRFRGVPVGIVESVTPTENHVEITARFETGNERFQREGASFAIVRPRVSLDGVSGLETLLTGPYIECLPGSGSREVRDFVAEPPVEVEEEAAEIADDAAGRLEIVLTAGTTRVSPDAPVYYRGITVGKVLEKRLSGNGEVDLVVAIDRGYAHLVHAGSKFWEIGSIKASIGFLWVKVDAAPLPALTLGGITFANPAEMGAPAKSGQRFTLHAEPRREWLRWNSVPPPSKRKSDGR